MGTLRALTLLAGGHDGPAVILVHGAANSATEMGGKLTARSAGPGLGAVFTLDLPFHPPTD